MRKKQKINLEKEKAFNEKRWQEIMQKLDKREINAIEIGGMMDRINSFDRTAIKHNRRDLLG